jgi:hypothetical protein
MMVVVTPGYRSVSSPPRRFVLQFDQAQIPVLAGRYSYPGEERVVNEIGPAVRERGYFTRAEFLEVCEWKTARSKSRAARNTEEEVREATRLAFSAQTESLRIWIPMALSGVSWPTASVLLHFGHSDRYPILDVRALEAIGVTPAVPYTLQFWGAYVAACRKIDDKTGYGMRTIDRALWQWSKERSASR